MKRDMDLIRDLLLKIEDSSNPISSNILCKDADEEEKDRIINHLRLMFDQGLFTAIVTTLVAGRWRCQEIKLTWEGHEFVDTLRDPTVWDKSKGIASKAGGAGFKVLIEIGKAVVKGELQKLGLPVA